MLKKEYESNIRKAYVFNFLIHLHFIGGVLVPFFMDWGRLSFTQMMILQSWFALCVFVMEIPTGAVSDYIGRKYSLMLAGIMNAGAAILYSSIPNFYVFFVGEFLWACASALLSGSDQAILYDSLKRIKKENLSKPVFARFRSFGLIGIMVSAPIGSLVGARFGLHIPMRIISVPCIIAFFVALFLAEPKAKEKVESKRYLNILLSGVKYFSKHRILKILTFDMTAIGVVAYFMIWFYQPLLGKAGVGIAYFGIVHAVLVGCEILIMNTFQHMERFFSSKKTVIFMSGFITGIAFITAGLTKFLPVVLLSILAAAGFGLSRAVLFESYMNKYIPSSKRATVLSTVSMFRRFGLFVFSPIIGAMADISFDMTLIILGAVAVIISLISKVEERHLID